MQTLVIDTNGIVRKLEQRGFSRAHAEGITEALQELDTSNLVTKSDLDLALAKQTITIIKWITGMLLAQAALIVALLEYLKWSAVPAPRPRATRACTLTFPFQAIAPIVQ